MTTTPPPIHNAPPVSREREKKAETVKVKEGWGDKEEMGGGGGDVRGLFWGQSGGSTTSQQLGSSEFKRPFTWIDGFLKANEVHFPILLWRPCYSLKVRKKKEKKKQELKNTLKSERRVEVL